MPVIDGVTTVLPAPPGYVVNLAHPLRQGVPVVYWVAGFGFFLSLVMMAQRLYTKMVFVGKLQLDDAFLLLGWGLCVPTMILCLHAFGIGAAGAHAWEISIEKFNRFMWDVYLAAAIYVVGSTFTKISLLLFYIRLSPQKWFRISIWTTVVFVVGYTVAIFFGLVFACTPISKSWDVSIMGGHCINRPSLYIATAAVNIASDVLLFLLPLPMVFTLQAPRRQKLGLALIFLLGSLTVVTSIIRVCILPQLLTSPDQTWVVTWASFWIIVEANLMIICASIPTVHKFLKHIAPHLVGEHSSGSKGPGSGSSNRAAAFRTIGMISSTGAKRKRGAEYSRFDNEEERQFEDAGVERGESYVMGPAPAAAVLHSRSTLVIRTDSEGMWTDDDVSAVTATDAITPVRTRTMDLAHGVPLEPS